ncbi:MAG TPA: hypothetical protein VD735_03610 [Candidatus Saccharimonadales bacterium]|nr:hypothetical protein [Candidatus Saccharimonadales bacterium]
MEHMRPHQLAVELANTGYEVVNGRVESERLGGLIVRAEGVWRQLLKTRFEEDENGHVVFELSDSIGDYQTPSDHIDSITAVYNDPRGRVTRLGGIARLSTHAEKATAYIAGKSRTEREPLLPEDPRWDAVVGTIERAVDHSWDLKRISDEQRWAAL